ncbi:sialidase family protein [Zhouia amylolytica]|uniref:exo-alpha-sialidase n=1 Tax=Zhouia amylolytica AD3 TaxID=1286632 RepID=W2US32_9FLAO|nr:sialidase family protein [Zhouia amylolytica]ETN96271.1 exo-alpha-sialidase [Zhouia amylolytica AD3]
MKFTYILLTAVLIAFTSCDSNQKSKEIAEAVKPSEVSQFVLPVLVNKEKNKIFKFSLTVDEQKITDELAPVKSILVNFEGTTDLKNIGEASVYHAKTENFKEATLLSSVSEISKEVSFQGVLDLEPGNNYFWLSVKLNGTPELSNKIKAIPETIVFNNGGVLNLLNEPAPAQRLGVAIRNKFDDDVDTYRIPGLATTKDGTLIAVYDIRYNSAVDLQEDVDVGMSRSTDGGQTWEPMKVIMDMGEYGGLPQDENGIGDPAVLVDENTGTIWVAALWLHGNKDKRAWWASDQGMTPEETGQFMLVKSEDDGLTWSEPINITQQIKNPDWKLFFNGPGMGITMKDGTLVFPAQFKDKEAIPHSTIIYSKDRGKTWKVGTGAKSETTEAQVVQLTDGSLMLNMRDDRNRANRKDPQNGRSVAITTDLGATWTEHSTSRKALIEPNCMASIITTEVKDKGHVLFFSNPDSKTKRDHITIKTSFDDGMTWPEEYQIELYEESNYGYSCLTKIDEDYLGILYEGSGDLYFQKIAIEELIK